MERATVIVTTDTSEICIKGDKFISVVFQLWSFGKAEDGTDFNQSKWPFPIPIRQLI
jgi:hypothetical protein